MTVAAAVLLLGSAWMCGLACLVLQWARLDARQARRERAAAQRHEQAARVYEESAQRYVMAGRRAWDIATGRRAQEDAQRERVLRLPDLHDEGEEKPS